MVAHPKGLFGTQQIAQFFWRQVECGMGGFKVRVGVAADCQIEAVVVLGTTNNSPIPLFVVLVVVVVVSLVLISLLRVLVARLTAVWVSHT